MPGAQCAIGTPDVLQHNLLQVLKRSGMLLILNIYQRGSGAEPGKS